MQILKPEIHASILENAESMFFALGYEGTSTRELAKRVGVSFSNLYRYFENKSDLFEAVMGAYAGRFAETMAGFLEHEEDGATEAGHVDAVVGVFLRLIEADRKKFVILMEGSQGTRFEPVRREVTASIEERIRQSLSGKGAGQRAVIRVIAGNLLNGILAVARSAADGEALREDIQTLMVYHLGGIQKMSEM